MTAYTPAYLSRIHDNSAASLFAPLIEGEPNGFVDRTEVTLSWDNATRTFTITPVGTSFRIYSNSVLFTIVGAKSIVIANTTGIHYIYFDVTGTLVETTVWSDDIVAKWAFAAHLYWNATTSKAVPDAMKELHGIEMPADVHLYLHNSKGTAYHRDGGLHPSLLTEESGDLITHIEVAVTTGAIWDEDVKHIIASRAIGDVIPVLYRTGALGDWTFDETSAAFARVTGTGRAAYNQWTGATWQLTELTNLDFCLMHLFAIPGITKSWMLVMGANRYTTIVAARNAAPTELIGITGLPLLEFKSVASFIIQTANSYANAVKSRFREIDTGIDFIDWRYSTTGGQGNGAAVLASTDALPEGVTNLYFTETRVRATPLTGVAISPPTTILATDSLLVALGKLQAQMNIVIPPGIGSEMLFTVDGNIVSTIAGELVYSS